MRRLLLWHKIVIGYNGWDLVRSDEFKKWFGGWENDRENSSKVLDENGEPITNI